MEPAKKLASLADLEALPRGVKGEIIEGVLYTMTRPRPRHQQVVSDIEIDVGAAFRRGRGGPGGWWILVEPGIELPEAAEFSPDLAGWRRERVPELPIDEPLRVVPDWVCEILSPSTTRYDLTVKRPFYARIGVPHHWMVDVEERVLTAYRLEGGRWLEIGVHGDETEARIEPFEAVPLDVKSWWP
ncbi:MAG TPA: Uma2 family endonuclease [Byssovorax sp.]|jgi:Uma2 family endonuclease